MAAKKKAPRRRAGKKKRRSRKKSKLTKVRGAAIAVAALSPAAMLVYNRAIIGGEKVGTSLLIAARAHLGLTREGKRGETWKILTIVYGPVAATILADIALSKAGVYRHLGKLWGK